MSIKGHKRECYSGTEPWNKCFCKPKRQPLPKYCTICSKPFGSKQALAVHKAVAHKHETTNSKSNP